MTPTKKAKKRQKQYRKKLLKKVLPAYGLKYRGDSKLLSNFVKGKINCSILKIVNIMKKADYRHTETDYDSKFIKYEVEIQKTVQSYLQEGMEPIKARKATKKLWRDKILREVFEEYGGYESIPNITKSTRVRKI